MDSSSINHSSTSLHMADTIGVEALNADFLQNYDIPKRYYINTLVLLPVNPDNLFLYWEVCQDFISSKYSGEYDGFMIKIIEKHNGGQREEMSFKVYEESGRYYVTKHLPAKVVFATIGVVDSLGRFVELLSSNSIKTPSDFTSVGDEVWMERDGEWSEIIKASLSKEYDSLNSETLAKEFQNAKNHFKLKSELDIKTLTTLPSSGEFIGSSENMSSFGVSSHSFVVQNNMKSSKR